MILSGQPLSWLPPGLRTEFLNDRAEWVDLETTEFTVIHNGHVSVLPVCGAMLRTRVEEFPTFDAHQVPRVFDRRMWVNIIALVKDGTSFGNAPVNLTCSTIDGAVLNAPRCFASTPFWGLSDLIDFEALPVHAGHRYTVETLPKETHAPTS